MPGLAAEATPEDCRICDLVGSTQLATFDPEDLAAALTSYYDVGGVIERWGGHVAEFSGDGASFTSLATAHEDDAERAVRGSLEHIVAGGRATDDRRLKRSRAAAVIATGLVWSGDERTLSRTGKVSSEKTPISQRVLRRRPKRVPS